MIGETKETMTTDEIGTGTVMIPGTTVTEITATGTETAHEITTVDDVHAPETAEMLTARHLVMAPDAHHRLLKHLKVMLQHQHHLLRLRLPWRTRK